MLGMDAPGQCDQVLQKIVQHDLSDLLAFVAYAICVWAALPMADQTRVALRNSENSWLTWREVQLFLHALRLALFVINRRELAVLHMLVSFRSFY
jgi:hypothetical protein